MGDRLAVHAWTVESGAAEFGRISFEKADGLSQPGPREYMLFYGRNSVWASWGIGCVRDGYMLWQANRGITIGRYKTLRQALDELQRVAFTSLKPAQAVG